MPNKTINDLLLLSDVAARTTSYMPMWDGTNNTTKKVKLSDLGSNGLFFIDNTNSKIGIGTTTPTRDLEISTSSGANAVIQATNTTGTFYSGVAQADSNVSFAGSSSNHDFKIMTNNGEKVRIKTDGKVGIGTTAPQKMIEVEGGTGESGILFVNDGNGDGIEIGVGSSGTPRIDVNGTSQFLGFFMNDSRKMTLTQAGRLGIGTAAPSEKLDVNGAIKCTSVTETSDYRLKENIKPLESALDKIKNLKPVSYNLKEDGSYDEGLIAHEVQEIFPSLVTGDKDAKQEDGSDLYQSVAYGKLVTHLVKAVQELSAEVERLKNG